MVLSALFPPMRSTLGPSSLNSAINAVLLPENTPLDSRPFSKLRPATALDSVAAPAIGVPMVNVTGTVDDGGMACAGSDLRPQAARIDAVAVSRATWGR
ncbi:hypothetical protein WS46_08315 [Burkholderia sp. RF4-BP95]|nr:hypothetical protein WS46_08315 [Burkholderia sp. RF4-BP95]